MAMRYHLCMSVRGALRHPDHYLKGVFNDSETSRELSPAEARRYLEGELAKGHLVIPCSDDCEGFDYSGGGCPGHEQEAG